VGTILYNGTYTLNIKHTELSRLTKSGKWVAYKDDLLARKLNGQTIIINRV